MKKKSLMVASAAVAIGLFAVQAKATDVEAPPADETTFYVSLFGGASLLQDVETDYYGSGYEVDSKIGYIVGGAIGVRIWDPVRAEVELSYSRWNADEIRRDNGQEGDASGHLSATYLLGNIWYDINTESSLTPYIGGGAGVAWADGDSFFFGQDFGYGDGELGFAFQLGAGVKYGLTENIALDVGYRFKGIVDVDLDDIDGGGIYKGADFYSHNLQAGVIFSF